MISVCVRFGRKLLVECAWLTNLLCFLSCTNKLDHTCASGWKNIDKLIDILNTLTVGYGYPVSWYQHKTTAWSPPAVWPSVTYQLFTPSLQSISPTAAGCTQRAGVTKRLWGLTVRMCHPPSVTHTRAVGKPKAGWRVRDVGGGASIARAGGKRRGRLAAGVGESL